MSSIEIVEADLSSREHQQAILELSNAYAMDPMGNGKPLSGEVRRKLISGLQQYPTTLIFLAFQDKQAVGIATCFGGFSTFAARPLINIHDFYIIPKCRGQNIGQMLLAAVERKARAMDCCKITLEVQQNNHRARRVYEAAGFVRSVYVEEAGGALFLSRRL
jgi:ribosomal protein S18 acetylase RimI-like enzyme